MNVLQWGFAMTMLIEIFTSFHRLRKSKTQWHTLANPFEFQVAGLNLDSSIACHLTLFHKLSAYMIDEPFFSFVVASIVSLAYLCR